jgi:hypothetical protein
MGGTKAGAVTRRIGTPNLPTNQEQAAEIGGREDVREVDKDPLSCTSYQLMVEREGSSGLFVIFSQKTGTRTAGTLYTLSLSKYFWK